MVGTLSCGTWQTAINEENKTLGVWCFLLPGFSHSLLELKQGLLRYRALILCLEPMSRSYRDRGPARGFVARRAALAVLGRRCPRSSGCPSSPTRTDPQPPRRVQALPQGSQRPHSCRPGCSTEQHRFTWGANRAVTQSKWRTCVSLSCSNAMQCKRESRAGC